MASTTQTAQTRRRSTYFTSVDGLERCRVTHTRSSAVVRCVAEPSGLAVELIPGVAARFLGENTPVPPARGPAWPEGRARTWHGAAPFTCNSSYRGIQCYDAALFLGFTLGDHEAIVDSCDGPGCENKYFG